MNIHVSNKKVGLVVLNYNNYEDVIEYIKKIYNYSIIDYIVIVDNCSTDESICKLKKIISDKIFLIISERNGGYGYGNNQGINFLIDNFECDYILITNPDVQYDESTVIKCMKFLNSHEKEKYAIVAPLMLNLEGSLGETAWEIPKAKNYYLGSLAIFGCFWKTETFNLLDYKDEDYIPCDCVAGSMLMVNTKYFVELGMYDENIFLFCEETTIGIKAKKKGFKTAVIPNSYFIHAHSTSINKSIKNKITRLKILWNSRIYVLQQYYGYTGIRLLFAKLIMKICIVEMKILILIKK